MGTRGAVLAAVIAVGGCGEGGGAGAEDSTGGASSSGPMGAAQWWIGIFHDSALPVGTLTSLATLANLDVREDGTATGIAQLCDDDPELFAYRWSLAGAEVVFMPEPADGPLVWQGAEVEAITLTEGFTCEELEVRLSLFDGSTRDFVFNRGRVCAEAVGPSCENEVVWCDGEPPPCS